MSNYDDIFANSQNENQVENAPQEFNKEDWVAKKQMEREQTYTMMNDMTEKVASEADAFKQFLDIQSRFDRFSVGNVMLIAAQMPDAKRLGDYEYWAEQGEYVKKGSEAISILEPGNEYTREDGTTAVSMNVKKVFDVSQTKGKQTPAPTVNRDPQALVAVMIDTSPVNVEMANELPHPNMGAFYDNNKQTLFVKKNIGDSVALCQCVAQELGHAQLSINSDTYSRRDMGYQAMCIGYMLCKKYGVDTKNFAIERIPDEWKQKEPKEIRAELSKTRTAMNEIHSRVSEEIYRQKQERSKEQAR